MPFRLDKKEKTTSNFNTDITDPDELNDIEKIAHKLDSDEKILFVANQSRNIPGGAILFSPNTVFATNKQLIIRNPTMMGMRESIEGIPYDKITSVKLEKGLFSSTVVIRSPGLSELSRLSKSSGLVAWGRGEDGSIDALPKDKAEQLVKIINQQIELVKKSNQQNTAQSGTSSIADEISKLAKLKMDGLITEEEFTKMKQDLMNKK